MSAVPGTSHKLVTPHIQQTTKLLISYGPLCLKVVQLSRKYRHHRELQLRVTGAKLAVLGTFFPLCLALLLLNREYRNQTELPPRDRGLRHTLMFSPCDVHFRLDTLGKVCLT